MSDTKKENQNKTGQRFFGGTALSMHSPVQRKYAAEAAHGAHSGQESLPCSIELDHIFAECVA